LQYSPELRANDYTLKTAITWLSEKYLCVTI